MQPRKCEGCGGYIAEKRLRVLPGATRCVACVQKEGDVSMHHEAPVVSVYRLRGKWSAALEELKEDK
jgi:hypothetical protein